jgi:oxygen-dependent protoporphyrinogen oxidase
VPASSPERADRLDPRPSTPVVAVVGGGMTGLAAAWEATRSEGRPTVVVLEAAAGFGGRVGTEEFAGRPIDTGADAFIARVPEGRQLCAELGMADRLVAPATGRAFVWSRGRLRPLPPGLVLGVPSRLSAVVASGILGPASAARALIEPLLPRSFSPAAPDCTVSELVVPRFGRGVDRWLADPLLGGIHAGTTSELSLEATAPQLAAVARRSRSLARGLRSVPPSAGGEGGGPVFLAPRGGMGELVRALESGLRAAGAELRTDSPVGSVARRGGRFVLETPAGALAADAVVLTCPPSAAAALLASLAPAASSELAAIEHASVAMVTLAYDDAAVGADLDGSGLLVPAATGRLVTACSWTSSKWPHTKPPGRVVMRVSAGRHGDRRAFELSDEELVGRLHAELAELLDITRPPVEQRVGRWPDSFPQYRVGHLERVARIESALDAAPGLAVAGAGLGGVGIPACIAQGRRAARACLSALEASVRP